MPAAARPVRGATVSRRTSTEGPPFIRPWPALKRRGRSTDARCISATDYDDPLYSFELLPADGEGADEGRYAVIVPQGRLVIARELRLRAVRLTSDTCLRAVGAGLTYLDRAPPGFARYGLDDGWARSMRAWRDRLDAADRDLLRMDAEARLRTGRLQSLSGDGAQLLSRLGLCAQLCGKGGLIVSGPAPRRRLDLREALAGALLRAREHQAPLARHGFGQPDLLALDNLVRALDREEQLATDAAWKRRERTGQAVVIRGALLGDLLRLVQVTPHVLGPKASTSLGRLLGRSRTGKAPTADAPEDA